MQKKSNPSYTLEFKQRAVELSVNRSVREVARELGISATSIVRWRAKFGDPPVRKTDGSLTPREMMQRLSALTRECRAETREEDGGNGA